MNKENDSVYNVFLDAVLLGLASAATIRLISKIYGYRSENETK